MRRITLWSFSVYLFTGIFYLGPEGTSAPPAKGQPDRVKLLPVKADLAEAVRRIHDNLLRIDTFVREQKEFGCEQTIKDLRDQLAGLVERDKDIRQLRAARPYKLRRDLVLRDRAEAFIYAWSAFGHLAFDVSHRNPGFRKVLLATQGPEREASPLDLLLTLYSQISSAEGDKPDPLRVRCKDGTSTRDLIGTPGDEPPAKPGALSLYALVNLQLDTWRESRNGNSRMNLQPLSEWLDQLQSRRRSGPSDSIWSLFDPGDAKRGAGVKERLERLADFTHFRHEIQDAGKLKTIIEQLELDRSRPRKCDYPLFDRLRRAAMPVEKESLPAAEIWLRYVFLLSFRGVGATAITSSTQDGMRSYWKICDCPGRFDDLPRTQKESEALLRWDCRPAPGHFDRAILDATRAAFEYMVWKAKLPEMEKKRFKAITDTDARNKLAKTLAQQVNEIEALETKYLSFYLPKPHRKYLLVSREPHPLLPDTGLSLHLRAWEGQSALIERERMERDLKQIAGQVRGMAALWCSVKEVSAATPAEWAEKLSGLSTHLGGAEWDMTALPTKTFSAYQNEVSEALNDLNEELGRGQFNRDLLHRYKSRRDDADIRDLEYAAAHLGVEIAKKGAEMAEILGKVAELNVEVARLAHEADLLIAQAKNLNFQAAQKGLVLANRARDLAAAQLDALIAARNQAAGMVKKAVQELEELRPRLEEIAKKIEESKKTSFLSVLRAIVKVVTIALAPFTDGASLKIGAAVDQALSIVDQLVNIKWDNPLQALGQLGDVVPKAAALGEFAIDKWGNADLNKNWGQIKSWIKARGDQAKKNEADAKAFLDHLKNLPPEQFRRVAGPLANAAVLDLPVQFDAAKGQVKFDLGKTGIRLNKQATKKLGESWKFILEGGGMLMADARARVGGKWKDLATFDDRKLKKELPEAIDKLIQTLPEGMARNITQARETVKNQKERLTEFVQSTDEAGRRMLAQILSGNLVVVIDTQGVIVVERALSEELKQTRARIEAFAHSVLKGKMKELSDRIKGHQDNLSSAIKEAQETKDEGALRRIAQEGDPRSGVVSVTRTVALVKAELEEMDRQIEVARGQLADAELGVEIGQLKLGAAELLKQGTEKLVEAGLLRETAAALDKQAKGLLKTIADLKVERAEIDLQTAERRVQSSRNALQRANNDCLIWGVNPLEEENGRDRGTAIGLAAILTVKNWEDPKTQDQAHLRLAAEGIVGQLQWLRLVGQANPTVRRVNQLVEKHYLDLLNVLHDQSVPVVKAQEMKKISRELTRIADGITNLPHPHYIKCYGGKNQGKIVDWLCQPLGDHLRDQEFADVPPHLRHRVVGRFHFLIDPEKKKEDRNKFPVFYLAKDETIHYFVLPLSSLLVLNKRPAPPANPSHLEFLVVPPRNAAVNRTVALRDDRRIEWEPRHVADSLSEALPLKNIRKDLGLWKENVNVVLRAGVGEWTVYLLASEPDGTEESRLKYAGMWKQEELKQELRFDPYIPLVECPKPK